MVRDQEKLGVAWDAALSADRPVIVNVHAGPDVPPLPPHIAVKDARSLIRMMGTEPELGSVLVDSAKEMLASVLPGRH